MLKNLSHSYLKFIFSLSFLWLIASCSFSDKTTKRYLNKAMTKTYDVIVVPGFPFSEAGWDSVMKGRVYWSKWLFDKGIAKNIIYSGSSVYTPYYEGEIMALYAIAIGIPKEHVFTETKAEHSVENLYYSWVKSKKLGFKSIALATDPFQAKQLKGFARKRIGKDLGLIPFVVDTLRTMHPIMTNPVIDYQQAYNKDFVSLTSRQSLWKRLRGTFGKNIDYDAYQ
jgi:uncharacterized SAM-binding protein YcdF (DUF218 family)